MVTYLGSFVQPCCGEGGTLQKYITDVCGECLQRLSHTGFAPAHAHVLSQPGNCLRRALGWEHFPGLSHSGLGSQVLHKGADSVGPAFCALSRSEQLRRPGAWLAQSPPVRSVSYHLPGPSRLVSWVAAGAPISGVPRVSSGELISGCDPPGRCQPSRIPRSLG